jgi:hypothetical protein
MNEKYEAVLIAHRVLDRVNADPDDDIAILARQFLRVIERDETEPKWLSYRESMK